LRLKKKLQKQHNAPTPAQAFTATATPQPTTPHAPSIYVHTLNATALAVPRIILAILENHFEPSTACIEIPKTLRPYLPPTFNLTLAPTPMTPLESTG